MLEEGEARSVRIAEVVEGNVAGEEGEEEERVAGLRRGRKERGLESMGGGGGRILGEGKERER